MSKILRDLKANTIKTYRRQITMLLKKIYNKNYDDEKDVLQHFKDPEPFMDYLKDKSLNTKISYITAVVVYMSPTERNNALIGYEKIMKYYQNKLNILFKEKEKIDINKKTEKEEANWMEWEDLKYIRHTYRKKLNRKGYKIKSNILKNKKDFDLILKYIITSLYLLHSPRRNLYADTQVMSERDWMELNEHERALNNYLVVISRNNKFFSFGDYKTAKIYGVQKIKVEKDLNSVLNFWLKFNKTK